MQRRIRFFLVLLATIVAAARIAAAADPLSFPPLNSPAQDFPPGLFSDGGDYHLSDFRGKLVVLVFYETSYAPAKASIPDLNKTVDAYADKPVKFIFIAPHCSVDNARAYIHDTGLKLPLFVDSMNLMETMNTLAISINNLRQALVVNPDGKIIAYQMTHDILDAALAHVKWKYKDDGYDPALDPAINLLEWNQYERGVHLLQPLRRNDRKTIADSAEKLYQVVHAEGEQWESDADTALSDDPVTAFDLYTKTAAVFVGDPLGRTASDAAKKLKTNPKVQAELSARKMYAKLNLAISKATSAQKPQIIDYCHSISDKYPDTPTAKMALHLADVLAQAPDVTN